MTDVYEKIRAVEFDQLPELLQRAHASPPIYSTPVAAAGEAFELLEPDVLDRPAPQALMLKLGIKSWRDGGALGVIYEGMNIRAAAADLLKRPTMPQRVLANAWLSSGLPLRLHLSRYVSFVDVSEVRFLTAPGECGRISACLRGASAENCRSAFERITHYAQRVAAELPARRHLVDVGFFANGATRLIDINPGLTPREVAELRARSGA